VALQTEAYGAEILTTLRGQREQIENSRDMVRLSALSTTVVVGLRWFVVKLNTADRHIDRASTTIGKMIRQ
jgi:vesicle transport through interaction with t-SNAREs protein 1